MNYVEMLFLVIVVLLQGVIAEQWDAPSNSTSDPALTIVYDTVHSIKPINQHGEILLSARMPNWSALKKDGRVRYVEVLLMVDSGVARLYGRDMKKVRKAVTQLLVGVNLYLYQVDMRMVVVDVREMFGRNITLEQFANYRIDRFAELPEHDVAILASYGYNGGIASVNGICGRAAVGITGFFPEAPMEYASTFFHELAHLLGLSHDTKAQCSCEDNDDDGCLRIAGFNNDCSAQALMELLPSHQCIQSPPNELPKDVLPICGNGVLEHNEQCDCGPEMFCKSMVCDPLTCVRTISDVELFLVGAVLLSAVILAVLLLRRCTQRTAINPFNQHAALVHKNIWDTPTFTPFASPLSESQTPIWSASLHHEDESFAKQFQTPDRWLPKPIMTSTPTPVSELPPIPPRSANYVNLSVAKSASDIPSLHSLPFLSEGLSSSARITNSLSRLHVSNHDQAENVQRQSPPSPVVFTNGAKSAEQLNAYTQCRLDNYRKAPTRRRLSFGEQDPYNVQLETASNESVTPKKRTVCRSHSQDTLIDDFAPVRKNPDKELQYQELISALTDCILSKPNNDDLSSPESPQIPPRVYPVSVLRHLECTSTSDIVPLERIATRIYDVPPRTKPTLTARTTGDGAGIYPKLNALLERPTELTIADVMKRPGISRPDASKPPVPGAKIKTRAWH